MSVTDHGNRFAYRLWAPVYDLFFDHFSFGRARRRALALLAVQPGERVLLPGVGTGADLPQLPAGAVAIGVDLSPHMLALARRKLRACAAQVLLVQGDATRLPMANGAVDAATLHLVLSVAPDGRACVAEVQRALRPEGRAVVLDKFLGETQATPSFWRRLLNQGAVRVGTDINRRLVDLLAGSTFAVEEEQAACFGGVYRIIRLVRRRD